MGLDIHVRLNVRLVDEQECEIGEHGWCITHEDTDGGSCAHNRDYSDGMARQK